MKAFATVPIILGAVAASLFVTQSPGAQDAPAEKAKDAEMHWYLVDQDQGVDLAGLSGLTPDQIADDLASGRYLRLSDYRTMDVNGRWTAAKSERLEGSIYIKPQLIRSFQQIKGDPMQWSAPGQ